MGVSRRDYRGNFWTHEEVAQLMQMANRGCGQREMSQALGRTISSIEGKLRLVRLARDKGDLLGPGLARYETPPFKENDDAKHLALVHNARALGFPVAFSRAHSRMRAA